MDPDSPPARSSVRQAATAVDADADVTIWVYRLVAGILVALAALTAATGARTAVIWFKICPALLTGSAVLHLAASSV